MTKFSKKKGSKIAKIAPSVCKSKWQREFIVSHLESALQSLDMANISASKYNLSVAHRHIKEVLNYIENG